jgi:hypothetical protein
LARVPIAGSSTAYESPRRTITDATLQLEALIALLTPYLCLS